jgi:site-specific recombinase XerD
MARPVAAVEGVYERVPGSGLYHARYRKDGKLVRKSFKRDRNAAIAWVEKARTLKRDGGADVPTSAKLPIRSAAEVAADKAAAEKAAKKAAEVLLGDLCDGLLQQIKDRPSVYKDQRNPPFRILRIKKAFGARPAKEIKSREIDDWLHSLMTAPTTQKRGPKTTPQPPRQMSPASQNRYKAMFSAIYKYGRQQDLVDVNPVSSVESRPMNNGREGRFLLPSEEQRIRAVLKGDIDACGPQNERKRKRLIHRLCEFEITLMTGMRKSEQYSLTWGPDVNFETKVLTLRETKNGTSRTVQMLPTVEKALRTLKAIPLERKRRSKDLPNESPTNSVFGIADSKRWWESVKRRAKVKDFHWHDNRHTFCSRLAQKGANLKLIQEAAGHKTIAQTAKYAKMDTASLRKGLTLLEP